MCGTCWDENGQPLDWTPTSGRALELIKALYVLEPTGGPLHVEVDDWNVEGETIVPHYVIRPYGADARVPDNYSTETHAVCDELAALLTAMTPQQRRAVLAVHDGFAALPS